VDLPSQVSPELRRVARAAKAKQRAEHEYREAIVAAREAGERAVAVADAAGVSRQMVYKLTTART
jgi:hypothetical protein